MVLRHEVTPWAGAGSRPEVRVGGLRGVAMAWCERAPHVLGLPRVVVEIIADTTAQAKVNSQSNSDTLTVLQSVW